MAHLYPYDDFMEPTVVDPQLSLIQPVKSVFIKPQIWVKDFGDEATTETTQLNTQVMSLPIKYTPWIKFLVIVKRVVGRIKENLRN